MLFSKNRRIALSFRYTTIGFVVCPGQITQISLHSGLSLYYQHPRPRQSLSCYCFHPKVGRYHGKSYLLWSFHPQPLCLCVRGGGAPAVE